MISEVISGHYSGRPFRILGICWLIYGVLAIVFGFWLVSFQNNATMMFGALLSRVSDPFTLMDEFHVLYVACWESWLAGPSWRTFELLASWLWLPRLCPFPACRSERRWEFSA
jgi:hypothetical protein